MKNTIVFFVAFCLLFAICGCRKVDSEFPQISISEPFENQIFSVLDTIKVTASVSDNENIESVNVYLCDQNFATVLPPQQIIACASNSFTFTTYFEIVDAYLPSGIYTICIKVDDGYNLKYKYQNIQIGGLNPSLLEVLFLGKNGSNTELFACDSVQCMKKFTFTTEFTTVGFKPKNDQLILFSPNELLSLQYGTGETLWQVSDLTVPPLPPFVFAKVFDKYVALGKSSSQIDFYNYSGHLVRSIQTLNGYYPTDIKESQGVFLVIEKSFSGAKNRISLYYTSTGVLKQSTEIDFQINDCAPLIAGNWIVCGEKNGQAVLQTYLASSNSLIIPFTINSEVLKEIILIDYFNFLIRSNNTVYWLRYQESSLYPLISNFACVDFEYSHLNARLFLISTSELRSYAFPSAVPSIIRPLPISAFLSCLRFSL